jgi:hypothetical protein
MSIYDLSDPTAKTWEFRYDTPETAPRAISDGEYIDLADGEGGLFNFKKIALYPQAFFPMVTSQD